MANHRKLSSGPHACCLDWRLLCLVLALPSTQHGQCVAAHTEGLPQLLYTLGEMQGCLLSEPVLQRILSGLPAATAVSSHWPVSPLCRTMRRGRDWSSNASLCAHKCVHEGDP